MPQSALSGKPQLAPLVRRIPLAIAALTLAVAGLTACGGDSKPVNAPPSASSSGAPTESASPAPSESSSPALAFTAPLTGLPIEQPVNKRPLTVMINNLKPARPQSGLSHADMVWEILAEGGITRLVGFFQSNESSDPIGPIRSIRPYLIELGQIYGGVLVHAGASNDALAILQRNKKIPDLDEINNAGAYFYRDKSRKAPHNLYSTAEKLRAGAEHRKIETNVPLPQLIFDSNPDLSGAAPASEIGIKFELSDYKVSYTYDASASKYKRSINGQPHVDKNNNEQLTATNLVVIATKHKTYDSYGRLEIDLNGGGEALVFQQGRVISCTWEHSQGDAVRLMKDGKELPMIPGVTYFHVVPNSKPISSHVTYQ
ncbi:DUF3048 domain-containing protein [Cohnella faecalis]|uniref:DUF3048 domain-containing protein n=2 Tax=Cohnella faecalis TaxID=2315694 RepID=A0A398CQT4_9BACL|nr:DUF3048 domain-containing protein [Cohnella faecalis]